MATTWQRLGGDTSKFAIRLTFSDDPDSGAAASSDDSATWGSYQIWAGERNLCAYRFGEDHFESVHWYLLPLLEWFAENWDALFHEERLPNRNAAATAEQSLRQTEEAPWGLQGSKAEAWDQNWYAWWQRHCVAAARCGGVFPIIYLRRWRDQVEISWPESNGIAEDEGVSFLSAGGSQRLPLMDVANPLYAVLTDAVDYLLSREPSSARLRLLRERLSSLRSLREQPWVWLLGLGNTFDAMRDSWHSLGKLLEKLPDKTRDAIVGGGSRAGLVFKPFPAALMFGAVSPDLSDSDRVTLLEHLAASMADGVTTPLDEVARGAPLEGRAAWEQGYELALEGLSLFGIDQESDGPIDIGDILEQYGVEVRSVSLVDRSIRGAAIAGPSYRPTILINRAYERNQTSRGERFSLAHELCHLLYDRVLAREVVLPSGEWAPKDIEQRANAFAAMFLMPIGRLWRIAEAGGPPLAVVSRVQDELETSALSTVRHLANLGLLTEFERDEILDGLAQPGRMA